MLLCVSDGKVLSVCDCVGFGMCVWVCGLCVMCGWWWLILGLMSECVWVCVG